MAINTYYRLSYPGKYLHHYHRIHSPPSSSLVVYILRECVMCVSERENKHIYDNSKCCTMGNIYITVSLRYLFHWPIN